MTTTTQTPRTDPLRDPLVVRLVLDEEQTRTLQAVAGHFVSISPGSYPGGVGRLVLHLIPIDKVASHAVGGILTGSHRAVRIKPSTGQPRTNAGHPCHPVTS
jgi:hypothetical protein